MKESAKNFWGWITWMAIFLVVLWAGCWLYGTIGEWGKLPAALTTGLICLVCAMISAGYFVMMLESSKKEKIR